jgi:integrase
MVEPPKRKRGKPVKYVLDIDGKPIIGLSFDTGNKTYYYSHWRQEFEKRLNFGSDYEQAIIKFKTWQLKRQNNVVQVEIQSEPQNLVTFKNEPLTNEIINQNVKSVCELSRTDNELILEYDFKEDFKAKIATMADISETDILEAARLIIAKNPEKLEIIMGKRKEPVGMLLSDIIEHYKKKTIFIVSNISPKTKQELNETVATWDYFTKAINKKGIGEINKHTIIDYFDYIEKEYKEKKYSTTWIRKKFEQVKRVFYYVSKREDNEQLEQVTKWCADILTPPTKVVKNPPKLIEPETFKLMLTVSNGMEKAILLLSMNAAYYTEDLATVPKSAINWKEKTIVFQRKKKGQMPRAAILWPETIEALKKLPEHEGKTLFYNTERKKPYASGYFAKAFNNVLTAAVEKVKNDNLNLSIDKTLTHSNCRDSFQTITKREKGMSDSYNAAMGHRQAGVSGDYIDARTYPKISKAACEAVHDYYFKP